MFCKTIKEALEKHTAEWMAIPEVVGTGIGEQEGQPCIKVFVSERTEAVLSQIPSVSDGHRVVVEESGEFRVF